MINWTRIESLAHASTVPELTMKWAGYAKDVGFDNFGVAIKFSNAFCGKDSFFARNNYSDEFAESYKNLKDPSIARSDARAQVSLNNLPAGAWRTTGETSYTASLGRLLPEAESQLKAASDFGIRCGITLPLSIKKQEWGFISFSSHSNFSIADLEDQMLDAMYFTNFASSVFERIVRTTDIGHDMSNRELEILRWAALGKTSWEISLILKISERTINFHLTNIAEKLGVKGRRAACSVAIAKGVISL